MNAHESLLDNFSGMQDEFNSSNNRSERAFAEIFIREGHDLEESLTYFNCEYLAVDKRKLIKLVKGLEERLNETEVAHMTKYQTNFEKKSGVLKQCMCNFFDLKVCKGDNVKKKISCEVKKVFDNMCDFNFIGLEEDLNTEIYNFKVNFENEYVRDEYCKDDFNKIISSFEHSLIENLRSQAAESLKDKQEIFSRSVSNAYKIIDGFRNKKR